MMSTPTPLLSVRERMKADLKTALKSRQMHIVTTLRSTLAEIDNAEAIELDASMVPVVGRSNERPRKMLSEAQIQNILQAEADAILVSLKEYQQLGKAEEAQRLQAEWDVLAKYL